MTSSETPQNDSSAKAQEENQPRAQEAEEPKTTAPEKPEPAEQDAELEEFDSLIGNYLDGIAQHEVSSMISVPVVDIQDDSVLVDLGDKAEGMVALDEFTDSRGKVNVKVGDRVDVIVMGRDDESGLIEVSHRAARGQAAWKKIQDAYNQKQPVSGYVQHTVKSGVLVDVDGFQCFMPASQIADHRVEDLEEWVNQDVDVLIIDLDERKNRAVVSRRRIIEDEKRRALAEILEKISKGDEIEGTVRSVLHFGAFLDIGGVDAFLPREEVTWERATAPNELLSEGQTVTVKIIKVDRDSNQVKVSRKALQPDPWANAAEKYPEGKQVEGEVVGITRFGAFVRLEEGVTGLIHVSDLSWNKGRQDIKEFVKEGDRVEAAVLNVDEKKRRMSLGLKQLAEDPWAEAEQQFPKGSTVKGIVTNLATFGAFVKLSDDIEGLIHVSDFSWEKHVKHPGEVLKIGEEVEAKVLKTDRKSRRISLGLKQLTESPMDRFLREHKSGSAIEGEVVRMIGAGAFINLVPGDENGAGKIDGFMHVSQINTERVEKPEDFLKVGETVKCKITKIEKGTGKISLSRKALIEAEERASIKQFAASPQDSKGAMKLGELMKGIELDDKPEEKPEPVPAQEAPKPEEPATPVTPEAKPAEPVTETVPETPAPEPKPEPVAETTPEPPAPEPKPEPVAETTPEPPAPEPKPEPVAETTPEPPAPEPKPEPEQPTAETPAETQPEEPVVEAPAETPPAAEPEEEKKETE